MNPDFAIILNFKLKAGQNADADFLVKTARNIGARAISSNGAQAEFARAGQKYTIALVDEHVGSKLTDANVIDQIVQSRRDGKSAYIDVDLNDDGSLTAESSALLERINNWMHLFGHALNEGEPCSLQVDHGFVLQNRHMHYQKYIFLKKPIPRQLIVTGLAQAPNRIEMIEERTEPTFTYENDKLTVDLSDMPDSALAWQVVRIQDHRPEDDIKETKF